MSEGLTIKNKETYTTSKRKDSRYSLQKNKEQFVIVETTETIERRAENTVNTPQNQETDSKGSRIVMLENGRKRAIVPRNSYRWLTSVTEAGPIEWDGQKGNGVKAGNVYEVGLEVPDKTFPDKESATTLAQAVKTSLSAVEDKKGNSHEPVIEILRAGGPRNRAVIRLLVDEFEQGKGMQGIKGASTSRAAKMSRARKVSNNVVSTKRAAAGRRPAIVESATPATRRKRGMGSFMDSLALRSYAEFSAVEKEVSILESKCPVLYSHLMKSVA
jgi:hypothetical protein